VKLSGWHFADSGVWRRTSRRLSLQYARPRAFSHFLSLPRPSREREFFVETLEQLLLDLPRKKSEQFWAAHGVNFNFPGESVAVGLLVLACDPAASALLSRLPSG
jgi:hypothetical protein